MQLKLAKSEKEVEAERKRSLQYAATVEDALTATG